MNKNNIVLALKSVRESAPHSRAPLASKLESTTTSILFPVSPLLSLPASWPPLLENSVLFSHLIEAEEEEGDLDRKEDAEKARTRGVARPKHNRMRGLPMFCVSSKGLKLCPYIHALLRNKNFNEGQFLCLTLIHP